MKNSYLFIIAWVEGSDSADGEETGVHTREDLYPAFLADVEGVNAWEIEIDHDGLDKKNLQMVALAHGRAEAWQENFTEHDSVSILLSHDAAEYSLLDEEGNEMVSAGYLEVKLRP